MSGVSESAVDPWLGRLPAGWSIKRLGSLGALVKGRGGSKEDNRDAGVPVVRYGDLYTKFDTTIAEPAAFVSEEDATKYTPLPRHSIVFAASGESAEDIGKSAMSLLAEPAVVGGDAVVCHPSDEIDPLYLAYALESSPIRAYKAIRSTGFTVVHISAGKLKTLPIPIPPRAEQPAIAEYLDRETARIDTLIEEQHRLIEMLRDRRNSVIDRGVFGLGGTGSTPMATIGRHLAVEPLLARIPDGWQVKRFKVALARVDERNVDLTQPMMSLKVTGELVPRAASQQLPDEASLPRYHVARVGDLVVNPMWLTGGAVGVAEVDGAVSPDYRVFRPTGSHHPRYLHHLMRSGPYRDQYVLYTRANTTFDRRVQQPDLDNLPLLVPPIVEQEKIAAEIDRQAIRIDGLISETERFIELAWERRAALITAAVTGQIDVREAP